MPDALSFEIVCLRSAIMPSNRGGRAYSSQSADRMTRSGLRSPKNASICTRETAAGRIALGGRVESRHARRLRCLQDVHGLRIGRPAEAVEIMRGQAVTPQQYVGLAFCEPEAGILEDAAGGRKANAVAIQRLIVVGVEGFQLHRGAVGIRRPLAQDDSASAAGQQNHGCETSDPERGMASRRRRFQPERLFDKPPRQIRNHNSQREQRDLVGGVKQQTRLGEPREGEQRPVPQI